MTSSLRTIVLLAATLTATLSLRAAELRLRPQCTPQRSLVTLGDIADIYTADAEEAACLKRIELFPGPASDQPRILRVRELQDLLALRGVNLAVHRFSGSAQVQVASEKKLAATNQPLTEQAAKRVQRRLQEAILKYLQEQSPTDQPRTVQFEMNASLLRAMANSALPISVHGGGSPWTGVQPLAVTVSTADGSASFPLEARVSVPSMVVAAIHSLPRGAIIQAADVTLVHCDPRDDGDKGVFRAVEEVVGKQTTKMVAEGKALTSDAVQAQLLVRRGDVVTVYAKAAGIRIHTTARAKNDGAMSDLVTVESLGDRTSFTTRVCGPRETEVFAQAVTME